MQFAMGAATEKMEKNNKILLSEREEKERNDTPKENEGKMIPQTGLSKYGQPTGLKRRRGTTVIMVANGEDFAFASPNGDREKP
jgi:hypothetical protein